MEIWKDIKNYEGLYQASNFGRVKSLKRRTNSGRQIKETILSPATDKDGYLKVNLSKNGKKKTFRVHQLIYYTFKEKPKNGFEVDHIIERNKSDNSLRNLQLVTHRKNCAKHKKSRAKTSKYTGVCYVKSRRKWKAYILINNLRKHLGYFDEEIQAHEAYQNELKNHITNSKD